MAAWRSHLKRTNKVVKPCACKRLTLKIWGQILHLNIHLDAGCSPVHASSAQEGDLPKTDPGSKSHKDDAVIGSTHHLVQRQNWTSESQKHKCSPGPLLRTRWTSPSRRRPSCRCSPRARRWSASTCTRSSGDRASFEEENAKKEETFFGPGWLKSYGHFGQHLQHQNYLTNTWLLLHSCFANLTRRENVKIILLFYVCKFCIYV